MWHAVGTVGLNLALVGLTRVIGDALSASPIKTKPFAVSATTGHQLGVSRLMMLDAL